MDEIGNIIYILFVVAMVLLSIFRKSKKKSKKPILPTKSTTPLEEEKELTASEVLTEIFGKEKKHIFPTPETVFKPPESKQVRKESIPTALGSLEYKSLQRKKANAKKSILQFPILAMAQTEEENVIDLEAINWRDAIIYSEILSPKF